MANYPQELAQYAVCQSHTGHMTGPSRLNTNEGIDDILRNRLNIIGNGGLNKKLNTIQWKRMCLVDLFSLGIVSTM